MYNFKKIQRNQVFADHNLGTVRDKRRLKKTQKS